jgi:hypothetical protein
MNTLTQSGIAKVWRANEKTDDKIIAFVNSTIYKANPSDVEIEHYISDLRNGSIPTKKILGIPLHYIKEIRMQESKTYMQIFFGKDSEEHLRIQDETLRKEVFNYFKANIPSAQFITERYSKLKAGKKPLIALAVVTTLFLWTLYYAIGFDHGIEYETANGRYDSVTGIVLAIASFGVAKTVLFFGFWFIIALWSLLRKINNPPVMYSLCLKR